MNEVQIQLNKKLFEYVTITYSSQKKEILSNINYINNDEFTQKANTILSDIDTFFKKMVQLYKQSITSTKAFHTFVAQLNQYEYSGGKNAFLNLLNEAKVKAKQTEKELLKVQRTELVQITNADEELFKNYLAQSKSTKTVYRGDSRGVNSAYLDNFQFADILPGGTTDISFFGMVEHQFTSTAKNGMVSTTSDLNIARGFATDNKEFGVIYTIEVKQYLDIDFLLKERNFKNRFEGQKEILIPEVIKASEVKSVTLYQKGTAIKTLNNN